MSTITIGKLASQAGVKIDTIRYYEKQQLLEPLARSDAGYRLYNEQSINQLFFIRKAQGLGFTLQEIKNLLSLSTDPKADCGDIREQANQKIRDIENRIEDLTQIKQSLGSLADYCPGKGKPLDECGILAYFYRAENE
ncbi:MAG: heavy metal-responsive transcriptional regulator [Enterobacterales bacterium]|nr:heavy metal-responsive transcriptional regulator [Enterobacterales bacterium]